MIAINEQSRPRLARGVRLRNDPITGAPILLYPEGILPLDDITRDILSRCTGEATLEAIIGSLAEEYQAEAGAISQDVRECLEELRRQMLVALAA